MMDIIVKSLEIIGKKRSEQLIILSLAILAGAILESVGISAVVPFVNILVNQNALIENAYLGELYMIGGFDSYQSFVIFVSISLMTVFIVKNLYLYQVSRMQLRYVYTAKAECADALYRAYLWMPYSEHLTRNSADIQRNINNEVNRFFNNVLLYGILLASESAVIILVLALLLILAPEITLLVSLLLFSAIFIFLRVFKGTVNRLGRQYQMHQGEMIKWVNQGLGAIKEIKLHGRERYFSEQFSVSNVACSDSYAKYQLIAQLPKFVIETIAVSALMLSIITVIVLGGPLDGVFGTLAMFGMAAFRLIPSINRISTYMNSIQYNKLSVEELYRDLRKGTDSYEDSGSGQSASSRVFRSFKLKDVSYSYPEAKERALRNVSLEIQNGQSVAFVGPSGAGKTTLVDIILGLLKPQEGRILIDDCEVEAGGSWRNAVGYVPQSIYLLDDTIRKNVAIGIPDCDIDDDAVMQALKYAQLDSYLSGLPLGIHASVGENGVRMSGGQRQRLGIARALYGRPSILVLDEATSALDNETEAVVMEAINCLHGKVTLVIIAHRLSTVDKCDITYRVDKGIVTINT